MGLFDFLKNKKEKLNERFNNALDMLLWAVDSPESTQDLRYFATVLDRSSLILDNYESYLEEAVDTNSNFDLKKIISLHKKGLKDPRNLSEEEFQNFVNELDLIFKKLLKIPLKSYRERMSMALMMIFANVGAAVTLDEIIKDKYMKLWSVIKICLPYCEDFKYKKHLPENLIQLVKKEIDKK